MVTSSSVDLTTYQAPELRILGSVHELTQGGISQARSDGILFQSDGGGRRVVNAS